MSISIYNSWTDSYIILTTKRICPACGGEAGDYEFWIPEVGGPWYPCGFCEDDNEYRKGDEYTRVPFVRWLRYHFDSFLWKHFEDQLIAFYEWRDRKQGIVEE